MKNFKTIALIVAMITAMMITTTAHARNPHVGADGYRFPENAMRIGPTRNIEIILYPSLVKPQAEYLRQPRVTYERNKIIHAFSVITKTTCTIHMVDPAVHHMPDMSGHELTHCLYGSFHN